MPTENGVIAIKLYSLEEQIEEKDKEIEKLKNDKKKVLELIENDYFEDGSFENYYEVLDILKGDKDVKD